MDTIKLDDLRKTGFKLTVPRKEILKTLSASNPLSAQEIHILLKQKGFNTDLVTVYRTLELFHSLGLVNQINLSDNTARYELVSDDHHHHLICIKCGTIEEVVGDETDLIKGLTSKSDFQVLRHSLEFFGFCRRCQ